MLNAYAAVANGGTLMRPMIVRGETDANGELVKAYEPEVLHEIAADAATLQHDADRRAGGHHLRARLQHPRPRTCPARCRARPAPPSSASSPRRARFHSTRGSWPTCRAPPGATDAELAIVSFNYSAIVPGNVSAEVVKYFLQLYYDLDQDLRLDPNDFSLVTAN